MNSKRLLISLVVLLFTFLIFGCDQNNGHQLANNDVSATETIDIVSPTDVVEDVIDLTAEPTQELLPTASIEYIEYYYSEFEDLAEWELFSKNELDLDLLEVTSEGLSLSLADQDDYFLAYSNVFGTDAVIEAEFEFLEGPGTITYQVICHSNDSGEYVFEFDTNSFWEIGKLDFASQTFESLESGNVDEILAGYQKNIIVVECSQDKLSLIINGELIGQVIDRSYSEGYTGFGFKNGDENLNVVRIGYFFVSAP